MAKETFLFFLVDGVVEWQWTVFKLTNYTLLWDSAGLQEHHHSEPGVM